MVEKVNSGVCLNWVQLLALFQSNETPLLLLLVLLFSGNPKLGAGGERGSSCWERH